MQENHAFKKMSTAGKVHISAISREFCQFSVENNIFTQKNHVFQKISSARKFYISTTRGKFSQFSIK